MENAARNISAGSIKLERMNAPIPEQINVGLKEWASVCAALKSGRQTILLRKGGIHESAGEFELEHPSFVMFPTYLHQNLAMLKAEAQSGFEPHSAEPKHITIELAATVSEIIQLKNRAQMDALDSEHVWTPPLVDMRFNYRPQNPLYLLVVRVMKLASIRRIDNTPIYSGCKSWVPLQESFPLRGATPVIDDEQFETRRAKIAGIVSK
jgi:hypothetical protein